MSSRSAEFPQTEREALVEEWRELRGAECPEGDPKDWAALYGLIHKSPEPPLALCLSGGGIRSATFCLGAIQGLAQRGLLERFHYLSTVSGGGYIGSWLSAWISAPGSSLGQVIQALAQPRSDPGAGEPAPITRLRAYSNYLSPVWGLSTDLLTLVAIFLRNLLLNWLVLWSLLLGVVALPRVYLMLLGPESGVLADYSVWVAAVLVVALIIGAAYVFADLPPVGPDTDAYSDRFAWYCFLPVTLSLVLLAALGVWKPKLLAAWWCYALAGAAIHAVAAAVGLFWRHCRDLPPRPKLWADLPLMMLSGAVGGAVLWWSHAQLALRQPLSFAERQWYATLGPPLLLVLFWLLAALFAGVSRRVSNEEDREWLSRSGARWLGAAVIWLLAFILAVHVPQWLLSLPMFSTPGGGTTLALVGLVLGAVSSAAGYWGKHGADIKRQVQGLLRATGLRLLDLASAAFVVLLVVFASYLLSLGIERHGAVDGRVDYIRAEATTAIAPAAKEGTLVAGAARTLFDAPSGLAGEGKAFAYVLEHAPLWTAVLPFGLLALAALVSWLLGVNTFSLHGMYGNRLVRAYLGAVRPMRNPHWFTGFDPNDNPKLFCTAAARPRRLFHVINAALNIAKASGDRLEWQQRKAASFTMTPLRCGSADLGFVSTLDYSGDDGGMSLGRAMTISGAAATPNMGYHTSALVAFVMTFFNVRLGWWLPSPGPKGSAIRSLSEPWVGLLALIREASARTTETRRWVYVSDGGHFENLGLYEMVKRRCRVVVVVDASCDPRYEFEDLENAIRKVRVDLGVPIEFDDELPTPEVAKRTRRHVAVGRIVYTAVDKVDGAVDGRIVYLKPVLIGAEGLEALDVQRYAASASGKDRAFPHQPTSDQFFDEAQFESYRMLGLQSVLQSFPAPVEPPAAPMQVSADAKPVAYRAYMSCWPEPLPKAYAPVPARVASGAESRCCVSPCEPVTSAGGAWAGLRSMGEGALIASALTVGGVVGVAGTVAFAPDATVRLSEEDRELLRKGMSLTLAVPEGEKGWVADSLKALAGALPASAGQPDEPKALAELGRRLGEVEADLKKVSSELARLGAASDANTRLVVSAVSSAAAAATAASAAASVRSPALAGSIDKLWGSINVLSGAIDKLADPSLKTTLGNIERKLNEIHAEIGTTSPRRNIRGVPEGPQR